MEKKTRVKVVTINKVFPPEAQTVVQDVVVRSHKAYESVTQLAKLHFKELFDRYEKENGFSHDVCRNMSDEIDITSTFFSNLFTVVSQENVLDGKRGRPFKDEKLRLIKHYEELYQRHHREGRLLSKVDGKNLSHVFSYLAAQISTCYETNVHVHFDGYVKRYIRCLVKSKYLEIKNCRTTWDLPKDDYRKMKQIVSKIIKSVLYGTEEELEDEWKTIGDEAKRYIKPGTTAKNRNYDLKTNPKTWMPYMMKINMLLEKNGEKLYSPCPLRTEFTPKHILLDTVALMDMLVTDVQSFRKQMEVITGKDLEKLKNKGHFYKKISNSIDDVDPKKFDTEFKTSVWTVLAKLGNDKAPLQWLGLRFNNVIQTDGYKVSLLYVDEQTYYENRFETGVKKRKEQEEEEFSYVHKLDPDERNKLLTEEIIRLFSDPGKGSIATIGDGERKGKHIRYTAVQRRFESKQKRNKKELDRLLDFRSRNGQTIREISANLTHEEASSKSCGPRYLQYLERRIKYGEDIRIFYQLKCHRRRRMRALLGRRSSEDKFIAQLRKEFNITKETDVAIFWGNWGKNPNIKNQAPSPGIGFRKRIHRVFQTYTVDERGTSSRCPYDEFALEHPKSRIIYDKRGERKREMDVHHLLRCQNETCVSKWWERDVLGVANIKKQTTHCLKYGKGDPCFLEKRKTRRSQKSRRCHESG